jgi:hypothetical protein
MGELHLEIYVERMKREYNVECTTGKPQVAFRETITQRAPFTYTHKKQTGGAGQYAKIVGYVEPMERDEETGKDLMFENIVMGGTVPFNYIPAVERVCLPLGFSPSVLTHAIGLPRSLRKRFAYWKSDHRLPFRPTRWWIPHRRFFRIGVQTLRDRCFPRGIQKHEACDPGAHYERGGCRSARVPECVPSLSPSQSLVADCGA